MLYTQIGIFRGKNIKKNGHASTIESGMLHFYYFKSEFQVLL